MLTSRVTSLRAPALLLPLLLLAAASCKSGSGGSPTGPGTPRELNSGDIAPGGMFQHRFAAAGTYPYHCIHHPPMTGTVQVNANAADTLASVSITSSTMSFPPAVVKPGGRVVWSNNTGELHTVTGD